VLPLQEIFFLKIPFTVQRWGSASGAGFSGIFGVAGQHTDFRATPIILRQRWCCRRRVDGVVMMVNWHFMALNWEDKLPPLTIRTDF
jgi:hypothetical protein